MAHFFGPPGFVPDDELFHRVKSVCTDLATNKTDDLTYSGAGKHTLFYQSKSDYQENAGKRYYKTYQVSFDEPAKCVRVFYARQGPMYGTALNTRASKDGETLVFKGMFGKIEILRNGQLYKGHKGSKQ